MTDELDRIRHLRPDAPGPSPLLVETERQRLLSVIGRESSREFDASNPSRRRWLLPTLATLATAAAGYALIRDVGTTTEISCPDAIIDAVSGDPVADCAALWRRQNGTEPPALVAYDNRRGGIQVVPADAPVPAGWTPLEPDFSQDARLIELDAALADYGDGLNERCYEPDDAEPVVLGALERLGLGGWSVRIDEARVGGVETCATHVLDADAQRVVIFPLEMSPPSEDSPFRLLAASVQELVDDECLTRREAEDTVRRIARDLRISEAAGDLVIHSIPDGAATCSRTDVNVGGRIEVSVRGA